MAELFRAANEIKRLSENDQQELLERASNILREMRATMIRNGREHEIDSVDISYRLRTLAHEVATTPADSVASELLMAAEEIRTLKIKLDAAPTRPPVGPKGRRGP
ncbi:MAG TPA: hypothetical protein VGN97_22500 [Mesorhizobium sp.]|nr:hypothetical protein [Mesorhizobium sp.]